MKRKRKNEKKGRKEEDKRSSKDKIILPKEFDQKHSLEDLFNKSHPSDLLLPQKEQKINLFGPVKETEKDTKKNKKLIKERKKKKIAKQLPRYVRCERDPNHQNLFDLNDKQHWVCQDCDSKRSKVEYICRLCYEHDQVNLQIFKRDDIGNHKYTCPYFNYYLKEVRILKTTEVMK